MQAASAVLCRVPRLGMNRTRLGELLLWPFLMDANPLEVSKFPMDQPPPRRKSITSLTFRSAISAVTVPVDAVLMILTIERAVLQSIMDYTFVTDPPYEMGHSGRARRGAWHGPPAHCR